MMLGVRGPLEGDGLVTRNTRTRATIDRKFGWGVAANLIAAVDTVSHVASPVNAG